MFKWKSEATSQTEGALEAIWELWENVGRWPEWDQDLEWAKIQGSFTVGTKGQLKPRGWKPSFFRILSVDEKRSFSTRTWMPITALDFHHKLRKIGTNKWEIVHTIEIRGLLVPLLKRTLCKKLKLALPVAVNRLAKMCMNE